jgi:methyl-accepting chemotaxis protein
MSEIAALASWIDTALAKVMSDLDRARGLLSDAMARLLATFTRLRDQLAEERTLFERALQEVTGLGASGGLVGVLRDVLSRFVDDMVRVGGSSVKIMMEVESLRRHAEQVAASGLKIENIAGTTRILSLNARIEAQRLGNAGAVFRVVADEIKALANQTGSLSKAIRDALAVQSASLSSTTAAVSKLAASDLDVAVASHKRLDETITRLGAISAGSLDTLARIQLETDAALQALQFEDMLTQLLQSIADKITVVRSACRAGTPSKLTELDPGVQRDTVTQRSLQAGTVELF